MLTKTKLFTQILALILLPAFILRPAIVNSQQVPLHGNIPHETKVISQILLSHSVFRHIDREAPDVTALIPQMSKVKDPSLLKSRLNPILASAITPPQSFLVLRI